MIEDMTDESNRATLLLDYLGTCPFRRIGHNGSTPLLPFNMLLTRQFIECLNNGNATDPIILCKLPLWRKKASWRKLSPLHALQQGLIDLEIQRQWIT